MTRKNLLGNMPNKLNDLDLKVLACTKKSIHPSGEGNLIGDVRKCAGFDAEVTFTKIRAGGLCQENITDPDIQKICDAVGFLPQNKGKYSVIERGNVNGIGIVSTENDSKEEVVIKKVGRKWTPLLHTPTGDLKDASVGDIKEIIESSYGDGVSELLDYVNGRTRSLPEKQYHDDDFGKSVEKLDTLDMIDFVSCGDDQCLKQTDKGYTVYYAMNRGKPNDLIPDRDKRIFKKGGVSMEFESHLHGSEKTAGGSRKIWIQGDALNSVKEELTRVMGRVIREHGGHRERGGFHQEGTGRLELKNMTNWKGRDIKGMVDEMAEYEKKVAQLGYTRPTTSTFPTASKVKISGGIHYTLSPPVTNFDKDHKPHWDLFLLNFVRLSQWWEPLLLGVTGSPVKSNDPPPNWWHSIRHHASHTVKAGSSTIKGLVPTDGAIGIQGGASTRWIQQSLDNQGKSPRRGDNRADMRIRSDSVRWSGASFSDCSQQTRSNMCGNMTDQAVEMRYFEYEPLHLLEERAEVVSLLMDRAYQLAAEEIEVPEARSDTHFNTLMWDVMTKGWEAPLGRNTSKTFSKIFLSDETIPTNANVFDAGKQIVDDLWENHYDDFFTKKFGVKDKPLHHNYMKESMEEIKQMLRRNEKYKKVTNSSKYGKGSISS